MDVNVPEIASDLLEWDSPWTGPQRHDITQQYDLRESVEELLEFIKQADDWIAEENSRGLTCYGVSDDVGCDIDPSYSRDAFVNVVSAILTAKNLRSELERIAGTQGARSLYDDLIKAFPLFESNRNTYVLNLRPEFPVPEQKHNPAVRRLIEYLNGLTDERLQESQYVFRQMGEYWLIKYDGIPLPLKCSRGLQYIHRLLRKPNQPISVLEVQNPEWKTEAETGRSFVTPDKIDGFNLEDDSCGAQAARPQQKSNTQAMRQIFERRQEIEAEIEDAKMRGDYPRQERLMKDKEALCEHMRKDGIKKEWRTFSNEMDTVRKAVSNAITRAKKRVKEHSPQLYQHLDNCISTGYKCSYKPENPVPWEL